MRSHTAFLIALLLAASGPAPALAEAARPPGSAAGADTAPDITVTDSAGCTDPSGLPRFEGARILGCVNTESTETVLPLAPWSDDPEVSFWESSVRLRGPRAALVYAIPPGRSSLEVIRGYRQALEALGYEILFDCSGFSGCGTGVDAVYSDPVYEKQLPAPPAAGAFAQDSVREPRILTAKGPGPDGNNYVFILAAYQDNSATPQAGQRIAVFLETVTSQGGIQNLILLKADELAQGIDLDGHVPVYGITFDPDQAEIKAESQDQVAEVARLLEARPGLSLYVVGHTDSEGELAHNLDLSRRRAEAVATALSRDYGIAPERLSAQGVGNLAPVAPQGPQEGRAMNTRIELVPR